MDRFCFDFARRFLVRAMAWILALCVPFVICANGLAHEEMLPPGDPTANSVRSGGLLENSYNYHRAPQGQLSATDAAHARSGGWYRYGFPVQSYRWGWFGAERNYPRVNWHDGYYGDCVRTAYRYGN